jgi:hypothetical protein
MPNPRMKLNRPKQKTPAAKLNFCACLGHTVALAAAGLLPAHAFAEDAGRMEKVEKENQELRNRLDALETVAKKEGILTSGTPAPKLVSALSDISISGFVTASYFHDSSEPPASVGHISPGYLWNRVNDSFSINKVKLTLASPQVQNNGEKFDVGFRFSLIAGQDAPIVNTKAGIIGFDYLREAYVEMNIPIGTGLDVRVGELISLLNYESGDGGAANINFSQGYQWFFTGNPPAAGVQLGYKINDWLGVKARVQNGLYQGPIDNNSSKTFLGEVDIKPNDKIWVSAIGFGGREDAGFTQSLWGASILGGWQATEQLGFGTELDYFNFSNPKTVVPSGDSVVWSTGLWTSYDFTPKVGLGLRAEFLSDKDGVDASGGALGFMNPPGTGQDLSSLALTLNYKPMPNLKIQPEIRFDHTSWSGGFVSGKQNRAIFGAGISYLF